jgi:hypothetical protein
MPVWYMGYVIRDIFYVTLAAITYYRKQVHLTGKIFMHLTKILQFILKILHTPNAETRYCRQPIPQLPMKNNTFEYRNGRGSVKRDIPAHQCWSFRSPARIVKLLCIPPGLSSGRFPDIRVL